MDRAETGACWCVYPAANEELCSGTDWDPPKNDLLRANFAWVSIPHNTSHSLVSLERTAQNEDVYDVFRVWGPADLVCFSVPLWLRLPVRHARGPKKKKHLTERRWFFQKTRWCEDSKKFQSMLCSQKLAPSMHQAVSWLTIDTSSVRPLFSLQPRLFPLSGQHISPLPVVPTSEQTQVEDAWLECLHNPIIHHFLMAKLSRNSLKIWMLQQAPQGSVFLGSTSNPSCFPIPFPCFSEVFKTTCWQCFSKHNDGSAWAVDGDHSGENAIGPWHFWHDQQLIPENGVLAMWCHVYLQRLGTRRASSKKHNNNDDNNDKHASFGKKTSPNSFSFGHGGRRMILHESLG